MTDVLTAAGVPEAGLAEVVGAYEHAVVFATVSGAHLYGFPSDDSDIDLRGCHLLSLREVIGLRAPRETVSRMWDEDGVEMDLVTHDLAKFARLLLKRNGYVLEQLLSPLVVHSTPAHEAMADLAPGLVTRHHAHHYRGFARTQWGLFEKSGELKPLLYTLRVLLTGIHLMRSGSVLAHLPSLAEQVRETPSYVGELIAAKVAAEHGALGAVPGAPDRERLAADVAALHVVLDEAQGATWLPDMPSPEGREALDSVVVEERLRAG
ncbi:nucleotidyltransferase domain-containing protein [Streptomyces sp. NPDC051940]|uniref:nucleotidyltransferase domain-containing protein n=1 Tax=Streptomyces sp. NPDC051940 TaxID=3155675 RepID=UPI00341764C9